MQERGKNTKQSIIAYQQTAILTISTIWNHPVHGRLMAKDFAFVGIKRVKCVIIKDADAGKTLQTPGHSGKDASPIQHGRPIN